MKYYFDRWHYGSSSFEENYYLEMEIGSYVYIYKIDKPRKEITWEAIYIDKHGNWCETEGESNTIDDAKKEIESLLDIAGYRKVPEKLRIME